MKCGSRLDNFSCDKWFHHLAALFYSSVNDTDAPNCCFIHRLMSPRLLLIASVFHRWLTDSTRLSPPVY